ncbi:hypothetical protein NBRC116592_12980 [Colwellia sp. KU-HH00111]|uniref:hypothetical protein n=1 Tax=Colwellia sp. KU-HH00111 TaxID=3127652 RepID=UPI003108A816
MFGSFFGSESKSSETGFDTGNRGTIGSSNLILKTNVAGSKNKIETNTTNNITQTDHGAIDSAFGLVSDTFNNGLNSIIDVVLGTSADNLSIVDSALLASAEANNNIANIAADSAANSAYLSDSVIASTENLASQYGGDLAYLTDSAMLNNAILADKVIDTTEVLASQHQQSLNDFGAGLKSAQEQYSADVGFLSNQSIQANAELTGLFGGYMADNSTMLNDSLLTLAQLQEQGLDSALEVAGNVALDDSVEGLKEIFKYLSIGAAVIGVAYAFRG